MKKAAFYVVCSLAITATFFFGWSSVARDTGFFWAVLLGFNLAIWSSYPRYRSLALKQLTITLTLLVMANPFISIGLMLAKGDEPQAPTGMPGLVSRVRPVGERMVGFADKVRRFSNDWHGHRTNGPIDYDKKNADVVRVVAIGASTTEEAFVDDRETWSSRAAAALEKSLGRKVELINTGVSGLRAEHDYRILVASAAYKPDIAIFLLGINDWNQAIIEAHREVNPPKPPGFRGLIGKFLSVDHTILLKAVQFAVRFATWQLDQWGWPPPVDDDSNLELKDKQRSLDHARKIDYEPAAVSADYANWIGKIMDECRARKIECLFVDQPTAYHPDIEPDLRWRLWMTPLNADYTLSFQNMVATAKLYNDWLGNTAREKGFPFCQVSSHVPATTANFFDDCHFNDGGAALMGKLVGDCLIEQKIGATLK
ncbi:MAG: SGNH/GDSL hydrolase family protein [Proteobacteria bacterium]|nr:SGNH/GDSL hydrolase family protein [Pseudomonadota bacterium]